MLKLTLITTTLLLFLGCTPQPKTVNIIEKKQEAQTSQSILRVPIHIRDNGYKNFPTQIFTTQSELNYFLETINSQKKWNKKENFLYTFKKQEIDFSQDYLIIYRFDEVSSSIILATDVPTEVDKHITVQIGKTASSGMIKPDIVYYSLAYIVDKNTIDVTFDNNETKSNIKIKIP
ncbi:MAG: hypothetical protein KAG56_02620 [Sulfurovaceae bacterium]|nr:hypothetical protein [Sulfurovaceae bacterium]